jgi:hypothetical protein
VPRLSNPSEFVARVEGDIKDTQYSFFSTVSDKTLDTYISTEFWVQENMALWETAFGIITAGKVIAH